MIAAKNQTVFQQSVNTHIKVLHHVYACMPVIVAGCAHIVEVCIIYIYTHMCGLHPNIGARLDSSDAYIHIYIYE